MLDFELSNIISNKLRDLFDGNVPLTEDDIIKMQLNPILKSSKKKISFTVLAAQFSKMTILVRVEESNKGKLTVKGIKKIYW